MKKATVYCHENTYNVYELHRKTIEQTDKGITIIEQLSGFADNLFAAWKDRNPVCKGQINNWHPDYIGKDLDVIFQLNMKMLNWLLPKIAVFWIGKK